MKINDTEKALIYQKFSIENLKIVNNTLNTLKLNNYNNKALTSSLSLCDRIIKDMILFYEEVELKSSISISQNVFSIFKEDPSLSKVDVTIILKNRKENPIPGKLRIEL